MNLADLGNLEALSDEEFREKLGKVLAIAQKDRQENALLYFKPVSDIAARVFESDARVFAIGGGNGCVPLAAPVLMADGSWKPLGEIVVGDMVIAADPETGRGEPAPVTTIWRSGKKPVYRVTFSDGGSFEATAEHMVPLYLGSGRKTTKGNAKRAIKRRLGDYIEPILRRGAKNPSKRISAVSPQDIQYSHSTLPMPPYLLGALLGDGSLSRHGVKFSNIDAAVLDRVRTDVESLGCTLTKYQGCDHGIVGPGVGKPNPVLNILRSLGLAGTNSYTKFIPRTAFGLSREDRLQLLAGLVDTDGTADEYATCSNRLAEDVAHLVRSLGGKASITERITRCQNGVDVASFRLYLRMNERLPLALPRKQVANNRREIDYTRRICRSAELIGVRECGDIEVDHPAHCYVTGDHVIVSNSGKTEQVLALAVACATGVFPDCMRHLIARRFRGPIRVRVVCESITSVLYPVMLPKLQWWNWTGADSPGGEKGHWGWVPPYCLKERDWTKSWSEKLRLLTVLCRDPSNLDRVMGESVIQFMSYDQDAVDFASGDYHLVIHDEPPPLAIWRENEARTMRVAGRMLLSMTWPDDPSIPVDWIFDEVYEPGTHGSKEIEWVNLYSTDNPHLKQEAIAKQAASWTEEMRNVRIYGKPIRFSNRVHPLFTDQTQTWCFTCGKTTISEPNPAPLGETDRMLCTYCKGANITDFNHVREFDSTSMWPAVFLLDPHPRKPHCAMWVLVDPSDDYWQVDEIECDGDPTELRRECDRIEIMHSLNTVVKLLDPKMGASPSSSTRGITWQRDFDAAGIVCELADDSETGRKHVNVFLKPDPQTLRPRIHVHPRCKKTISQMQRFIWDEYKRASEKEQKQAPKPKNDDFPALWRYLMNYAPTFRGLNGSGTVYRRPGTRRGAY